VIHSINAPASMTLHFRQLDLHGSIDEAFPEADGRRGKTVAAARSQPVCSPAHLRRSWPIG